MTAAMRLPIPLPLPEFVPLGGGLGTSGFGIALVAAVLVGIGLARLALRDAPDARAALESLSPWAPYVAVAAFAGGRALNQPASPDWVWADPRTWIGITGHSLSFLGVVAGAAAAALVLPRAASHRRDRRPPSESERDGPSGPARLLLELLDRLAPAAAAALAVGWLGLPAYGTLTRMPWGIAAGEGAAVHPLQLYGALGFAILSAWLFRQLRRHGRPGRNVAAFFALAFALRLFLGFFTPGPTVGGALAPLHLSLTQWGDLAGLAAALALGAPRVRIPRAAVTAISALLLASAFLAFGGRSTAASLPAVGFAAPGFSLPTLDGDAFDLSGHRGEPLLLNFWASWCGPCREEMPRIASFATAHDALDQVVGIDFAEPEATVRAFTARNGLAWTFLLDRDGDVRARYGVRGFPTSVFVNRDGVITRIVVGPMTDAQIARYWREAGGN